MKKIEGISFLFFVLITGLLCGGFARAECMQEITGHYRLALPISWSEAHLSTAALASSNGSVMGDLKNLNVLSKEICERIGFQSVEVESAISGYSVLTGQASIKFKGKCRAPISPSCTIVAPLDYADVTDYPIN